MKKAHMKIELVDPETLKSAAYNPRQISREELNKLIKSIKQFGFVDPALVRKHDNMIVGGHQRVKAALELGLKEIPVVYLDITENDAKLLNVALNKISGEWEEDKLTELLAELQFFDDVDELLTGFDEDELDQLLADLEEPKDGLTDDDAIPEEVEAVCKEGQLWQLGDHRLLCGDSTDAEKVNKLLDGNLINTLWTDPPYGIDYQDVKGNHKKISNDNFDAYSVIYDALSIISFETSFVCCNWKCYTPINEVLEKLNKKTKAVIVWDKEHRIQNLDLFGKQHEWVIYSGLFGGQKTVDGDVWQIKREVSKEHPTSKPIELITKSLMAVNAKLVYDPFLGSGSTLIACEKTNRVCYGMELDPHYCDVIIKRWEDYTGQKAELLNGSL